MRLALLFLAAVFGLVLLSLAFGSSPASADGGSHDSGLIPAATELVADAVAPVTQAVAALPVAGGPVSSAASTVTDSLTTAAAHVPAAPAATISKPVSDAVDGALLKVFGQTVIGDALGPAPLGSVLLPVADVVDGTVEVIGDVLVPVLDVIPGLVSTGAGASAAAVTASITSTAATAISGFAHGRWPIELAPTGTGQPGASSASPTITVLPAAALGAAFFVLLFSRRLGLVDRALPASPVYETDTSPD